MQLHQEGHGQSQAEVDRDTGRNVDVVAMAAVEHVQEEGVERLEDDPQGGVLVTIILKAQPSTTP